MFNLFLFVGMMLLFGPLAVMKVRRENRYRAPRAMEPASDDTIPYTDQIHIDNRLNTFCRRSA